MTAAYMFATRRDFSSCWPQTFSLVLTGLSREGPSFYGKLMLTITLQALTLSKTLANVPWALCLPFMTLTIFYYLVLTLAFSSYLLLAALRFLDAICGMAYVILFGILVDDLSTSINVACIPIAMLVAISSVSMAQMLGWICYISPIFYAYAEVAQTEFASGLHDCHPGGGGPV